MTTPIDGFRRELREAQLRRQARERDSEAVEDLERFFVPWDQIAPDDIERYDTALELATEERHMQEFLESDPQFLVQMLEGGHGRWVVPRQTAWIGIRH